MRDDQIRRRLAATNPWWLAAPGADPQAWAASDLSLLGRRRYDIGYRSDVLGDVANEPLDDRLIVLRGPRRVGKSVALKDTIFDLCGRPDVDVRQIIYIAADEFSAQDLHRAVVLGRDLTRSIDLDGQRSRAWFIDEVTSVEGWTTSLKFLRDNTLFGLDLVVCTGSSWTDEADVGRDLLAGRAGSTNVRRRRLLLPMPFRDFVSVTRPELVLPEPVDPWDLQSPTAAAVAARAELNVDSFDLAWQAYLTCGGYPRAVSEFHSTGVVGEAFLIDLEEWLHRDVDRNAPEESIPRLLAELHARTGSPLNRTRTATDLGYQSRQSFDLRLVRLVRTFGAIWCHQVDDSGRRVPGAQPKLYLADPILGWLGPRLRAGSPQPDSTRLTESALGVAIAAAIEARQPGRWASDEAVGYVRTGGGLEVDFAPMTVPTASGSMLSTPVEAKWVSHNWRSEAKAMTSRFSRGVVATKDVINTKDDVWALPAPLVALLLH